MDNEIYDIVMQEFQVFFGAGDTVEPFEREICAKTITDLLEVMGYKRQRIIEKVTAFAIYNSLYKTALLCNKETVFLSADSIKVMAKTIYNIDLDNFNAEDEEENKDEQ